ncbi:unnamed protein product [Blepharisma stoltei]|uniref:Uncharacterized protein n=1 Tax=Blepharisma stoltei TaxID=1481888 RepID=A0AAU9JLW3_9CILI|nr:unnamed protein product [Blepharisma stoltei]
MLIRLTRSFARSVKKTVLFTEAKEKADDKKPLVKPEPGKKAVQLQDRAWMGKRYIALVDLPDKLHKSAQKVFSGRPSKTIKEWGYKTAQILTELHGLEKPQDITKLKPFATTYELIGPRTPVKELKSYRHERLPKIIDAKMVAGEMEIPKIVSEKAPAVSLKYQEEHAIGYTWRIMPGSYGTVYRCLSEAVTRLPNINPTKILDYGAGTGAGSFAAMTLYPNTKIVAAVEPSKNMRTIGKKLTEKLPQIQWYETLANLPGIGDEEGLFDIVLCSYVLGEVENAVTRNLILDALWHRTNKLLLFIEPGTPKGFRLIYSIREWVLNTMTREEANIVAPCPHEGVCPQASDKHDWCHFSQFASRWPKAVIGKSPKEMPTDNEKFSYILLHRGPLPRQYLNNEEEAETLQEKSFFWKRLVHPAIKRKGNVIVDVCEEGKKGRYIVSKSKYDKESYRFARKSHWGDLWPYKFTTKNIR